MANSALSASDDRQPGKVLTALDFLRINLESKPQ
jgi:hypothetical protein